MRIDRTVLRETGFVAAVTGICSVLMHAGFLIAGRWTPGVLWGNLIGAAAGIGNFFFLGLTLQTALERDEKGARNLSYLSWALRMLMMGVAIALGLTLPGVSALAAILHGLFHDGPSSLHPCHDLLPGLVGNGQFPPDHGFGDRDLIFPALLQKSSSCFEFHNCPPRRRSV